MHLTLLLFKNIFNSVSTQTNSTQLLELFTNSRAKITSNINNLSFSRDSVVRQVTG
jgi:hypothetical protein